MQWRVGPHPANRLPLSVHSNGIPARSQDHLGAAFHGPSKNRVSQELQVATHGISNLVDAPQGTTVSGTSAIAKQTKILADAPGYVGRYQDAMPVDEIDTLPVHVIAAIQIQSVKLRADTLDFANRHYSGAQPPVSRASLLQ
jgi:hypothetical protein